VAHEIISVCEDPEFDRNGALGREQMRKRRSVTRTLEHYPVTTWGRYVRKAVNNGV
jgi:hypothetical protein